MSASCDVAASEIGYHINAAQLGQKRRVVQLERVASAVKLLGAVAYGLSMGTDGAHRFGANVALLKQRLYLFCINAR